MKRTLLLGTSVILMSAGGAQAALKNVEAFNAEFVSGLNNKPASDALRKVPKSSAFTQVKNDIKNSQGLYRVYAYGNKICRSYAEHTLCFSPVQKGSEIGIQFDGHKNIFFSKNSEFDPWKKDFNKFLSGKTTTSWFSFFVSEAQAQLVIPQSEIVANDARLIFATREGWLSFGTNQNMAEKMAKWPDGYLENKDISCANNKATLEIQRDSQPTKITSRDDDTFIMKIGEKSFLAELTVPLDTKQCTRGACIKSTWKNRKRICTKRAPSQNCSYPLPQYTTNFAACENSACTQTRTLTREEWLMVRGAPDETIEKLRLLDQKIKAILPSADLSGDEVSFSEDNGLAGKSVTELQDLGNERNDLLANAWTTYPGSKVQESLMNTAVASRCCSQTSCREQVYRASQINIAPTGTR